MKDHTSKTKLSLNKDYDRTVKGTINYKPPVYILFYI